MAKTLKDFLESYDFNRAAIAKQRLQNLRHAGRRVRGASIANLMRSAGLREEEMDEEDLDQLDEVLTKDAKASDWIHDFVHSTNPKFEGKSKKERIKMALGAYYGKQNEEVKQPTGGLKKACWTGYTAVGMKEKNGRKVPNCVPTNEETDTVKKDASGKVVSWKHEGDWKKTNPNKNPEGKVHNLAGQALKKTKEMTNEELVGGQKNLDKNHNNKLDAQDFKILRGKKKVQENHEYEDGSMSIHELKQIKAHVDWILEMLKPETDMPEWVQAKITLAADYLSTACDYLHVELNEGAQYAGLEKEDKPGKIKTAVVKTHPQAVGSETVEGWKDAKKPVKESYDEEGNVTTMAKTYQEFMEGMIATKVAPNVTRYTGGSYGNAKGAKYGNTDYDKETLDTKDDEGSEEQKRGRGRPAGSKSGARGPRIK